MLSTILFSNLSDFIFYIFEQDNEDTLFEIWLNKDDEHDFPTFKENQVKHRKNKQLKKLSEDEEKAIIEQAANFIKPR